MNIPLLIIIFTTFIRTHATLCVAKEVKSTQGNFVPEHFDYHLGWVSARTTYPTLYEYIVCENVKLQAGKQLVITSRDTNELFKYIIFKNCTLSVIPVGVFPPFLSITEAVLNASKIQTIEHGAFSGLGKLEELHLEDNEIAEILRGTLNSLTNLKKLDLSRNNLEKIEDNSLHGLLALEKLKLSQNNLRNTTSFTFNSLHALKSLDLAYNHLSAIEENSFANTRKLEELLLNNNLLTNIPLLTFQNTTALRILDISFNEVGEIDFRYLPTSLIKINVSNNVLNYVKDWSGLQNIKTVDFRKNRISDISAIGRGIIYLYLGWNNLEILDSSLFSLSDKLNELDLSHNSIQEIQLDTFKGLSELQYLYLHYNRMKNLPIGCFKDLISLKFLYLSHNFLTNLEFGTFAGLSNLNKLFLDYNKLIVIHESSFHVLSKLEVLRLNDNLIYSIQAYILLKHLKTLKNISLNNNNWTCNSLLGTISTFKIGKVQIDEGISFNLPNVHGIPCTNERIIKTENDDGFSTFMTDIDTSTVSGFETPKINSLGSFSEDNFHNSNFYKYLDQGFRNSSFYTFFNSDWMDNFANYLEKRFNNSVFFKFFEEGFTKSSFYIFFNSDFSKQFGARFNNTKFLNEDVFNSSFYNYFNEYFKSSDFFKDLHNDMVRKLQNSNFDGNSEHLNRSNAEALKIIELEHSNRYIELTATKAIILMSAIVALMLINTFIILFFVVWYRLHLTHKHSKTEGSRLLAEADIELI